MRSLKKHKKIGMILLTLFTVSFTCVSMSQIIPSADKLIIFAADASAELTVGGIIKPQSDITPAETVLTDKPPETEAPVQQVYAEYTDDSYMLSYGELEIPSGDNEELPVSDENDIGAEPYPESLENRDGEISSITYGFFKGDSYVNLDGGGQVRNVTSVSNDELFAESRLKPEFTVEKNGLPQVLIMHTHETESYEPYARDFYDASFTSRTTDDEKNVSKVGDAIAAELEKAGIGVIHDVTKHDFPSYNGSYDRSRVTVSDILEEYPSIKIVLDVHRDAIERSDGTRIAPLTEIDGKSAAQVMLICGCDDGTMGMPNCKKNFRFASLFQRQLESDFPTLTRPMLYDYRKYNQDLTTGSVLVEVGSNSNSLDQAVYTGTLIGKALVNLFSDTY